MGRDEVASQKTGTATFGLDFEKMVAQAWRVFLSRPLTLLGVSCLVQILWLPAHLLGLGAFFWLPFTLCVPFATVLLLRNEVTDRSFLGWIHLYPRILVIYAPAALAFIVLCVVCGFASLFVAGLALEEESGRLAASLAWGPMLLPILAEAILGNVLAVAALLAVRKRQTAIDSLLELFSTRRQVWEALLLGSGLALFGLSGFLVCCIGVLVTITFSWICLGVAYYQMFEE